MTQRREEWLMHLRVVVPPRGPRAGRDMGCLLQFNKGKNQVLGLLVWALIADTTYHLHAAYGWVMFVSIFFWVATVLLFMTYLLQLPLKFYVIPWPLVLVIFNAAATILYITAFITCSAAVQPTSWRQWDYNRRAAASFFACLVMLTYGVSTFLSFRAWKGLGSNAATSQVTNHA
ncbi:plasmolipin isoform X2 [Anser cygnoides]|uniref:plasmolipin isoform X2 n=1 Tax=Anser cygnoides TaxID=8845 RepID=UPI0034D28B6F